MLHYTVDDGLPSNTVYNIYKDSDGFLWIATDKGIARYNGIRFETFTTNDGLPDNEIFFFKEDYNKRLWLATYNGELCYYKDFTFHTAANTSFLRSSISHSDIRFISVQKDSSIIINFWSSQHLNIKDHLTWIDVNMQLQNSHKIAHMEKINENKYMYEAYDKMVYLADTTGKITDSFKLDNKENLSKVTISSADDYYLCSAKNIYTREMHEVKKIKKDSIKENNHYWLLFNSPDTFLATQHGLIINDSINILKNYTVSCIAKDINDNYWISTHEKGIFELHNSFKNAQYYPNVFDGKVVYCSNIHSHIIFITSTYKIYDLSNGNIRLILDFSNLFDKFRKLPLGFYIDSNFHFLATSDDYNIEIPNLLSNKIKVNTHNYIKNTGWGIKKILNVNNIFYIMGTVKIISTKSDNYILNEKRLNQLTDSNNYERIYGMAEAFDSSIYYSTAKDLFKIEKNKIFFLPQFKNSRLKTFDFLGKYLIGITHNNRMLMYNLEGNVIDSVANENCIWNNLYRIDSNHVLISTNRQYRLLTLNPDKGKFAIRAIENPFLPLLADQICIDEKYMHFFKDGSITSLSIENFLAKPKPPKLFFTLLKYDKKQYPVQNEMEIPFYKANNITVSYTPLSFEGKDVTYQYSISKTDENNWRDVKGEELNLIQPGYGTYTIKVRAKTLSSDYSQPITFTLHILKPFWATWWFITLSICAFLIVVGIIIRYRIRYIVRKNERLHESEVKLMKLEYKALNALMNPHFIFNSLNNMQALVNKNEKLAANKYLSIFANLIRRNMHNISLELIPLSEEMEVVAGYLKLEKLRFKDLLGYEINIADEVDTSEIMVPPLLVQPLVENSIKHGLFPRKSTESCVKVEIYEQDNRLVIAVKDNGIGMEAASKKVEASHQSYGLDNIRKRLEQLSIIQNRQISLNIGEEKDSSGISWTVVTITISLS